MKIVVVAVLWMGVGCSDRVTLRDAYRETSDITCNLELQCNERLYIAEYGAPTAHGHTLCVDRLTTASLGTRNPEGDVNTAMLDACVDTLSALTCGEWGTQAQWPSSCVRIPR